MTSASKEIIEEFGFLEGNLKLELLLEFSESLPELDDRFGEHPELLEISIRGYQDWNSLPLADKSRFDGLMTQKMLHLQKIIVHHKNGLIDDENYNAWLAHTAAMMKTPGGQQWLKHARNIMAPDIIFEVDQFLANNPDAPSFMETYAYLFDSDS